MKVSNKPNFDGQQPLSVDGMRYCPVCGFSPWAELIEPCDICPCCYTEYGFDDTAERQKKWLESPWFQLPEYKPNEWDLQKQFQNAIEGWDMWKKSYLIG